MNKRFNKQLSLVGSLAWGLVALTPIAYAEGAPEGPPVNAQQLALTESVLKFCGPIDPASAKKLQAKIDELVKGASAAALTQLRKSEDYQKARAKMDSFISKVDEHNAKTMCSNSVDE